MYLTFLFLHTVFILKKVFKHENDDEVTTESSYFKMLRLQYKTYVLIISY